MKVDQRPFCIVLDFPSDFPWNVKLIAAGFWVGGKRNGIQLIRTEKEQKIL